MSPPAMIEADRDKLVKILRMFSSDHDGEVVAAARLAHNLLQSRSLDWDDLIIQGRENKPDTEEEWSKVETIEEFMIRRCNELSSKLNTWEREFITSIGGSIIEWGHLTPKQASSLGKIVTKLRLRGVWDDNVT